MILTYKVKHNRDFSNELQKAIHIANFSIHNRDKLSSKYVKHMGLKSVISNQILKKYGRNKKCKSVKSINLIIPNQGIKIDRENKEIYISSLNLKFNYYHNDNFTKINQIEISNQYIHISCEFDEPTVIIQENNMGVDLNATGHCAVLAIPHVGKVEKLGKSANHIHKTYKDIRKKLQEKKKFKRLKKIKRRENNKIKNLNHKISKKIVQTAKENNCNINLENLKGIRNTKTTKKFRYSLNSWSFYQLKSMIEYKSKKLGVHISYINPYNTSKTCSKCGLIGYRDRKIFKCPCGHVDHADVNASFNIALNINGQSMQDRDCIEGSTDTPQGAIINSSSLLTLEPHAL